jgi:hypothetical protein
MPVDNFRDDERERRLRELLMLRPTGQNPLDLMQDYSRPPDTTFGPRAFEPLSPLERALLQLRMARQAGLPLR